MRLAVGSDERTHLTDFVVEKLRAQGHQLELCGALAGQPQDWPEVGEEVARKVALGECQEGIVFCWTGTGVSIAANKVPGVRAALCPDAATAQGARRWNHANVLVMSLRLTSEAVAEEIMEAWQSTPFGQGEEAAQVARLANLERKYGGRANA
ncbi:MAG TPA: RpiB/LacA/LacB family sugar-phosphate isomerase [Dehalococcoidia bacterium]|nr:RpiB/LacA/LacB family sugar-phosphate isomerase [Dehalococcoidia bacterium]